MSDALDCVIVGYNDIDFQTLARKQKRFSPYSGAYHELLTNSVLLHGERKTYMDLINHALEKATGANPQLSVFDAPSLGVCYLKSYLFDRGFDVEIVNFFNREKDALQRLLVKRPLAVAITTTYYVDNQPVREIVEFVREQCPVTRIIVGGPHIYNLHSDLDTETLADAFRNIGADWYIIDSQGEATLASLLSGLRTAGGPDGISNVAYFDHSGRLHVNTREVENNELDRNSVRWHCIDQNLIRPVAYLRTARSCPFACSFCNYPTLAGQHVLASLPVLEKELEYFHDIGTRYLVFIDDTFNVPLPRFKELLRMMIRRGWNFQWISFFRCSNADEEAFDLMAKSGCLGVLLGIESGDQTILNNMNKFANVDRYKWGMKQLHSRRIATYASLIFGFPGETVQTVRNTLDFIEETGPTFYNVQLYYHDMRSPIARRAAEFEMTGAGYSWKHRTMDWKAAAELAKNAFKSVRNSIPLSLYAFSIWGLPYLLSKGIELDEIVEFGKIAREMLIASFDDVPKDFSPQVNRIANLLGATRLGRDLVSSTEPPLSCRGGGEWSFASPGSGARRPGT